MEMQNKAHNNVLDIADVKLQASFIIIEARYNVPTSPVCEKWDYWELVKDV